MTRNSASAERPTTRLVLTERAGLSAGPELIRDTLHRYRTRMADRLATLGPEDWEQGTRCTLWSVHQVLRHLVDVAGYHVARLAKDRALRARYEASGPFRPARTPLAWLTDSEGQSPEETLAEYRRLTEEEHRYFGALIAEGHADLDLSPLRRPVHWSVRSLHVLWDAWLHERDMMPTPGTTTSADTAVLRLVTLYGLLMPAANAAASGQPLHVAVALTGSPDGTYEISGTAEDVAVATGSALAPRITAEVTAMLESVTGRGPGLADVAEFPDEDDTVPRLAQLTTLMA